MAANGYGMAARIEAPEEAPDGLVAAGDACAGAGDLGSAAAFYRRALELGGDAGLGLRLAIVLSAAGRPQEAADVLTALLRRTPAWPAAWIALAEARGSCGQWPEAEAAARAALDLQPDEAEALIVLAQAVGGQGRAEEARQALRRARAGTLEPERLARIGEGLHRAGDAAGAAECFAEARRSLDLPALSNNLAEALRAAGRVEEARETAAALIAVHPTYAHGWHALGGALLDLDRVGEAVDCLRQAVALQPGLVPAWISLGRCERRRGRMEDALAAYVQADTLAGDQPTIAAELGQVLQQLERHDEAVVQLARALRRQPDDAGCWTNLAVSLIQLGRTREGTMAAERAIGLAPERPEARLLLARCLIQAGEMELARQEIAQAVALAPRHVAALLVAGRLLEGLKRQSEAAELYRRVLELAPGEPEATGRLVDMTLSLCDWRDYDGLVATVRKAIERSVEAGGGAIDTFNLQALPLDYRLVADAARVQARRIAATAGAPESVRAPARPRTGRSRIRLGYALAYTHLHSLPVVLKELVGRHDRDRFEVFGYAIEACNGTPFSQAYRGAFDRFAQVPQRNARAAARQIRADGIDILVDTTGLTSLNCMALMSFRPAPVQAHFLGYSITTGSDRIDYLISDRTSFPPELRDANAERLVLLPDTFMATVREAAGAVPAPTRAAEGLPDDAVVFANFNHSCKFSPATFGLWMAVLAAVPDSVLWLGTWVDRTQENLRQEAAARGIAPERLRFAPIVDRPEHLARLPLADLALDCLEHNGGVTTVDALWCGLPVVSMLGTTPASRLGASLLGAAGMGELVAADRARYVALAIGLAKDARRRATLRGRLLAGRTASPLFDQERYVRNLERGYVWMWRNHLAGNPPRHYDVDEDRAFD